MKQMTVTDFSRNFSAAMNEIEFSGEEILLFRNHRQVARITPEATHQTALQAMSDLHRTLHEDTARILTAALPSSRPRKKHSRKGTLKELRNPWLT
jgi:antitoxin (DNA-binding transcriptional repressor) of toxin-antitoxin stability system